MMTRRTTVKHRNLIRNIAALFVGGAMFMGSTNLSAATFAWTDTITGPNLTGNWSAGAGWSGGPVSAADTTLTFGYTAWTANSTAKTTTLTNDVASPFLLNVLTFGGVNPSAGSGSSVALVNIDGSPLNFVVDSAATPVINLNSNRSNGQVVTYNVQSNVTLGSSTVFTGNGTATFNFSGIVSGTTGFTKSGTSALTLSNASNDFTGGVTLSAGGLILANTAALGSNTVSVTGNSTISSVAGSISNTINISNGVTLGLRGIGATNSTTTFSSPITGAGGITLVQGAASGITVALSSSSNTFTGNLTLPGGTGANDFVSFNSIGDGGSIVYNRLSWRSVATYTGSSALNLSTRSISLGTSFGGFGNTPGLDGGGNPINMFSNTGTGVVTISPDMAIASSTNNGIFYFGGSNSGDNTFSGLIADNPGTGTLGIGKWDAGKWIVSNANNSFNGNVYLFDGTLSVPNIQALGNGSAIQFGRANTGILEYTGSDNAVTTKQAVIGDLTSNSRAGGATILNNGTGTLSFTNANFNTLTVPWTGTLSVTTVDRTLTLGGSYNGNGFNEIQGTIQDNVAGAAQLLLTVSGSNWKLSGTNTYTGGTVVNGGILALSGNNTVSPTSGSLTVNASTLRLEANIGNTSSGISSAIGYTTGSAVGNASPGLSIGTTGVTFQLRSDSNVTFAGTSGIGGISGKTITIDVANNGSGSNNAITFSPDGNIYGGTNTLNITGSNGYSLILGNLNSNGTTGTLTFNPTTASVTVGTMTANTGTPARTVALDGTASGNSVGAITSLNYSVTKSNSSTWTLTGANTYTGATTVSAGVLVVAGSGSTAAGSAVTVDGGWLLANGTVGGTVNVNTGGTLGGTGIVDGAVTVGPGGTLAPGASPGPLTLNTSLTLDVTSNSVFELGGTTIGTGYDNVTLGGSATSLAFGGNLSVVNFGMFDMDAAPNVYDLFSFDSMTLTGSFSSVTVNSVALTNNAGVWTAASGLANYEFTESTGDLAITAIPEPSTLALGGLAMLGLAGAGLRRRRMRKQGA